MPEEPAARPSTPGDALPIAGAGKGPPGEVLLAGVAHVFDVRKGLTETMDRFQPRAVALELDRARAEALSRRYEGARSGVSVPEASARAPLLFRAWGHLQNRLAARLGDIPGGEMLQGARLARERGLPIYLIDDPLSVVAPRLVASLSGKERLQLLISTLLGLFLPAGMARREVERYSEARTDYLEALRVRYPNVSRVLIDERNDHMASRLATLAGQYGRVMAVLGDAHLPGIERRLQDRGVGTRVVHLEDLLRPESRVPGGGPPAAPPSEAQSARGPN
jgi:pheromone shutdown protein TraB